RAASPAQLRGARRFPDVPLRMYLDQELPVLADELPAQLVRHVLDGDRARAEVPLQPVELVDEVAVELSLQVVQRRLRRLSVALLEQGDDPRGLLPAHPA